MKRSLAPEHDFASGDGRSQMVRVKIGICEEPRAIILSDAVGVLDPRLVDLHVPDELDVLCCCSPEDRYDGASLPMLFLFTTIEVLGVVSDDLARRRSHGVQRRGAGEKGLREKKQGQTVLAVAHSGLSQNGIQ